jgi:hypothetical protein
MTMRLNIHPMLLAVLLCYTASAAGADADDAAPAGPFKIILAPGSELSLPSVGPGQSVKNVPYVLDVVKERQQILGDGNQIVQRTTAKGYRDSAGRTREESVDDKGNVKLVVIKDPDAGVHWVLNPQLKTASKMAVPAGRARMSFTVPRDGKPQLVERRFNADGAEQLSMHPAPAPDGSTVREGSARAMMHFSPGPAMVTQSMGMLPQMSPLLSAAFGDMKWAKNAVKRDLPPREIDGVKATGVMRSYEIPAGEVGNRNAIVVSDETWYAPDLRITLLSKHSDPRTGDSVFRIENLKREEPASNLFAPPPDYTVRDLKAITQRAIDKKAE